MIVTPAYAAVFALFYVGLSARALLLRRRFKVGVGHGDEAVLARAIGAHANFAEYVPLALLLVLFREMQDAGALWVHGLCITLLAGRVVHAYGVSQVDEDYRFRTAGMAMTFTVLISASVRLLLAYA